MKKNYFLAALFCCALPTLAQNVNFTATPFGSGGYNACTVDMNGDYLDDIVTIQANQITVYTQQVGGALVPVVYAVPGVGTGFVTPDWSIAAGDIDANGFNDLVFGNGSRISVVKANATGTGYSVFTYPQNIFSQRTNFVDIDNDGNLDLFACHDVAQSHAYRNDGAGNLIFDTTLMPTLAVGGNYASVWSDYDSDGDADMYMAKCRGGAPAGDPQRINLLYTNNGNGTFTENGAAAGVNDGAQSWSTAWADYDNDGDIDFVLSNISDQNRLYRNNGDGTFTDIYATSGIASQVGSWEVMHADFNNDGFVDFLWENSLNMYLNNGDMTFTGYDMPFSQGGIADLNNDGFLDVQINGMVYYNNGNPNKWLKVKLQGVESNRNGLGARVEIHGAWGIQVREVRSGEGFANMSSLNVHFGIGSANAIEKVVIKWPSGVEDVIMDPSSNQSLFILEGSSPALGVTGNKVGKFNLYPNPTNDYINISTNSTSTVTKAEIYDLTGKLALSTAVTQQRILVQELTVGTYVVLLTDSEGKQHSQKFIKN
ncbi:MAG TPA: FG-GAP-like repeat-containing protein [Flavobacterium sp.]|jgi:hypothetical protein